MLRLLTKAITGLILIGLLTACGARGPQYSAPKAGTSITTLPARVLVVPFEDEREFDQQPARIKSAPPFSLLRRFKFTRPDEAYTAAGKPFRERLAEELAQDLDDSGLFQKVTYARLDKMPEKGTYDLLLRGTLLETTQAGTVWLYGLVMPLGIYFYDAAWYVGLPKTRRDYKIKTQLQWYNGYDDAPIGTPVESAYDTPGKTFWVYAEEGRLIDVSKRMRPAWNDLVAEAESAMPGGDDPYWATLKRDGETYLAKMEREEEFRRKGSPPVFSFLSPDTGSTIRASDADVRWSISAPNGLRRARLVIDGNQVGLDLAGFDLTTEESPVRSVAARTARVPLELGTNQLAAEIEDWRGNVTTADLQLSRLPEALAPAKRHALLIGMGSSEAVSTVRTLEQTLTDPYIGQFDHSLVTTLSSATFDVATVQSALREFGSGPVQGELAFVYIALPGIASDIAAGTAESSLALSDLLDTLRRGLATDTVFVAFDIDWDKAADKTILSAVDEVVPTRWGVAVSNEKPSPAATSNGRLLMGAAIASQMTSGKAGGSVLTMEQLFDRVTVEVERNGQSPDVAGRFNPNITMVSYK